MDVNQLKEELHKKNVFITQMLRYTNLATQSVTMCDNCDQPSSVLCISVCPMCDTNTFIRCEEHKLKSEVQQVCDKCSGLITTSNLYFGTLKN